MKVRENEQKRGNTRFTAHDISMMATMLEQLSHTIDIMFFLMERKEERNFVTMLVSAQNIDLKALLEKEKRETDMLFEIDACEPLYALICQDTKIDGGYHFAQRVVRNAVTGGGKDVYCTELEVRTTSHKIKYIIYRLMELFLKAKKANKHGEIVFKALN
ncbi:hypothetical protein YH65_07210 [Sulfurovum lithotrophicum]|uniref:Uncharacterized protein n=1 Tax=Sulfurovum lithotrophicum TaxID=206403 RepID=A0A7U4RQZ1_9BACT|nr:hypothetical protein [Sulfurovum lithotrophicum]AKF25206.1 hypothetical protein YH65_07210 [Sulfurovum lithotrophicum]